MAAVAMAAAALGMPSTGANDVVFSLLDDTWYSQSILNGSRAPRHPNMEGEDCPAKESAAKESAAQEMLGADARGKEPASSNSSNSGACSGPAPGGLGRRTSGMSYHVDESEMRKVFERFDQNGDGQISCPELRRYMSGWGIDMSEAEVKSMIRTVDRDRDGKVDFQEFFALYQRCCEGGEKDADAKEDEDDLLEAFRVFDKDGDGFISARELQEVLQHLGLPEGSSLTTCENMIRGVDRDGNGRCDVGEFQEMMSVQKF